MADKMTRKSLIIIHVTCWVVPLCSSIAMLIQACVATFGDEASNIFPALYFCVPAVTPYPSLFFFYIPVSVFIAITFVAMSCSFTVMLSRNHHIFHFQWRTLVFGLQCLIFFLFEQILFYYFAQNAWDLEEPLVEYSSCVASYPRDPFPPCTQQHLGYFWFFSIFNAQFYGWMIIFSLVVYWTNPLTWKWWHLLITTQSIPNMDDIISSYSNTA